MDAAINNKNNIQIGSTMGWMRILVHRVGAIAQLNSLGGGTIGIHVIDTGFTKEINSFAGKKVAKYYLKDKVHFELFKTVLLQ